MSHPVWMYKLPTSPWLYFHGLVGSINFQTGQGYLRLFSLVSSILCFITNVDKKGLRQWAKLKDFGDCDCFDCDWKQRPILLRRLRSTFNKQTRVQPFHHQGRIWNVWSTILYFNYLDYGIIIFLFITLENPLHNGGKVTLNLNLSKLSNDAWTNIIKRWVTGGQVSS